MIFPELPAQSFKLMRSLLRQQVTTRVVGQSLSSSPTVSAMISRKIPDNDPKLNGAQWEARYICHILATGR